MKTIKPISVAIFMLLVLAILLGLLFLTTEDSETNKEGFFIKQYHIKYPTSTSFFELKKDTISIKQTIERITTSIKPLDVEVINLGIDSLLTHKPDVEKKDANFALDFSKIDTIAIERISYPKNNPNFLSTLKKKLTSNNCRIIHYGDSQLEGDRITGYLRNRLQKMYGGSGPGFIPIKQAYHQISAVVEHSNTWERNAIFDPTQERFSHKKYGVFLSSSRFTPVVTDSTTIDSLPITTASITIKKSTIAYQKFRAFVDIGLHYGNCDYPIQISVFEKERLIQQDSLITDSNYHNYQIKLPKTPSELKIELKGKVSADFFGLTLDGTSGVQMDNVAMRGASGTIFTRNNNENFKRMLTELDPKIMILQFGGNTVPYIKDSIGVTNYTKSLKNQINWLKRRKTDMSFIFIGPTDLTTSVNGKMVTYDMLPYLNKQLKELCNTNNVAYWDMFHAMGGKNSMSYWVKENLVGGDYIHFTPKGTKYISELFFTALYLDLKRTKSTIK